MIELGQAKLRVAAFLFAALAIVYGVPAWAAGSSTLQAVRERGHVVCGVSDRLPGLSAVDRSGHWSGLEVEFCGAVAAAVTGERKNVKFRAVSAAEGARALTGGDIDILLGGTAWTLSREADLGLRSAGVLFHDGQGLLVPKSFGVSSVLELSGASICVQEGTGAEKAVASFFEGRQMRFHLLLAEKWADTVKAYKDGSCTLLTGDLPSLAFERLQMAQPADQILLPDLIAEEEIGPFVRQGDDPWLTTVRWTLLALIEAEQIGLSSATLADLRNSSKPRIKRFLGKDAAVGSSLGLAPGWTERVIAEVGNYGEIFDRTLGEGSRLKLPRGANDLWTRGGLLTAPQFR
jgi:general L-amino acid transport system substrate-binding protein